MRDLDFLYYQFMPLYRLPIYSNLAEKRPVIVSASLSSACLPTSLVIQRCRRCFSISTLSFSLSAFASSFYTSFLRQSRFSPVEREEPHSCADGRCDQDVTVIEREGKRMSLADGRERIRKEDRMSEESVMRSLNTDAGLGRYIVGKGETKKTRSHRTGKR